MLIETVIMFGLVLCCLLGIALTALRMPGTWLILFGALGYGWFNDWQAVSKRILWILVAVAVFGELVELLFSVFTARRAGASRKAAWGGLIGGFVGMFCLSPTIPIVPVGPVIGALLGCFVGATLGEMIVSNKLAGSARVGLFSALGMALGTALKLGLAFVMAGIVLTAIIMAKPGP